MTGLLSAVLVVTYALIAFYTATQAQDSPWAVLVAIGPASVAALLLARKALTPGRFIALTLTVLAVMFWAWPSLQRHLGWTYYLQHLGVMLFGALAFGHTLTGSHTPLCTRFAGYLHETLSPALLRYTRQVTMAWSLFFVVMAIVSTLLFFSPLPWAVWSAFDTLLTLPLVGLMFVAEYAMRRLVIPQEPRMGITSAYRAYRSYSAKRRNKGSQP
ncbi:MAG: hypothetical protein WAO76_16075 [Georgfuchsia sp.]